MKRTIILLTLCCLAFLLAACGTAGQPESGAQTEAEQTTDTAEALTQEQALAAVKHYCLLQNPELEDLADSDEYTVFWDVTTNEDNEIVVLYRSYTGAETRYYIDPASGEAYVTESVPGITEGEQRTEESLNVRDYLED